MFYIKYSISYCSVTTYFFPQPLNLTYIGLLVSSGPPKGCVPCACYTVGVHVPGVGWWCYRARLRTRGSSVIMLRGKSVAGKVVCGSDQVIPLWNLVARFVWPRWNQAVR